MTKKINEDFIMQLNPHARALFEEYKIAFEKKNVGLSNDIIPYDY